MKTIAIALAFFASFAAHAEWFPVVTSADEVTTYSMKSGSFKKSTTEKQIIVKATHNNGRNPEFWIVKMSDSDCKNQLGSVRFFDTSNRMLFSQPYVSNGGTIAQFIGDIVCYLR